MSERTDSKQVEQGNKQIKKGKKKQAWTERAVRRAGRACPDRLIRICTDGTLELVPVVAEAPESADDLDRELRHGQS